MKEMKEEEEEEKKKKKKKKKKKEKKKKKKKEKKKKNKEDYRIKLIPDTTSSTIPSPFSPSSLFSSPLSLSDLSFNVSLSFSYFLFSSPLFSFSSISLT
ncbi:hypothetical protein M8J77_009743 [Diaphorina citri]|nr:hypothetical protein M8J77_009743 [Diaphorina citri]